jgi:mannose-6-phosphate isomerase-like protein (cupin superfamily)
LCIVLPRTTELGHAPRVVSGRSAYRKAFATLVAAADGTGRTESSIIHFILYDNIGFGGVPGLHVTETVDVVTVVSGELYAVLETTTETLLRPGGTFIQRGTKHARNNRGTEPVTVVAARMAANRS